MLLVGSRDRCCLRCANACVAPAGAGPAGPPTPPALPPCVQDILEPKRKQTTLSRRVYQFFTTMDGMEMIE